MTGATAPARWRVAQAPALDEDGETWRVVLRADDRDPGTEGAQIIVTSTAETQYDSYDPEQDVDYDVEYSYTTSFEYQVWAPDDRLTTHWRQQAPYSWHNYAPSFEDALDSAMHIVQQVAENPGGWKWDGSAESLGT